MSSIPTSEIRLAVERAFRATRLLVEEAFAAPPQPAKRKLDGTLVTDLDRLLEERLAEALGAIEPSFGIVSEESGELRAGQPTWVLDPLDGTFNFTRRIPLFASQVALVDGNEPLVAAIYEPLTDDLAWAARGEGAWRGNRRLRVSQRGLADTLLLADIARSGAFTTRPDWLTRLRGAVFRLRALGCAGLHLRAVAEGTADAFLGTRQHPSPLHDVAPGALLVREAGGIVTSADGTDALSDRRTLLAANPQVHADLAALLAELDPYL